MQIMRHVAKRVKVFDSEAGGRLEFKAVRILKQGSQVECQVFLEGSCQML